jgi:uncharacterized RDD family membrane protein YckC
MPRAAYCSECQRYVWVSDAGCENGHPKPCLRNVHETAALPSAPKPSAKPRPIAPPIVPVAAPVPPPAEPSFGAPVAPAFAPQPDSFVPWEPAYAHQQAVSGPPAAPIFADEFVSMGAPPAPSYVPAADSFGVPPVPDFGVPMTADQRWAVASMPNNNLDTDVFGRRVLALFLDSIFVTTAAIGVILVLNLGSPGMLPVSSLFSGASLGLATLIYYVNFERSKYQATPGKMLLGIKVVNLEGDRINSMQSIVRNLCRIIDNMFMCLPGLVSCLSSERHQRIGDRLGETLVIRNR